MLISLRGDLPRQRDALLAVVDAQTPAGPALVAERKEQRAVAAAEIEEGGGGLLEGGGGAGVGDLCVEELEEFGFGVGVVEPDGAAVGWVGGVVG